jgi:predicted dehydrogenase
MLEFKPEPDIRCRSYHIGCIGAGFIMADVQLAAYAEAGFTLVAIASRTRRQVAARWSIPQISSSRQFGSCVST